MATSSIPAGFYRESGGIGLLCIYRKAHGFGCVPFCAFRQVSFWVELI